MSLVVKDQIGKYRNDDLFKKLSQPNKVKYADFVMESNEERLRRFMETCHSGQQIGIVYMMNGLNLELPLSSQDNSVDYKSDPVKVHIISHLILNGVCVRWRGWIDGTTLVGNGCLEFDEQRAQQEEQNIQRMFNNVQNNAIYKVL